MTFPLALAGATALALLFYLVAVLIRPERSEGNIVMTIQGWTLILLFHRAHGGARQADGAVAVRRI